ncbi:hypothetical protein [Geodermatophilus nigrescens]|uniref:Uncharacterized protein n=1 Tax=Geodermatophilus nigrescens TaxID=1070870 RepID=A0A1M5DRQ5_9ACTN|nr:hypothetical protein [Geodermatophilus nigrescens]SHF69606.1 hypothetical protein SAMN05444351_0503 [Geodermatophilus nigrescens]
MPRWRITHLEDAPALAHRPGLELKYDDGRNRVWLPTGDGTVLVERLDPATGVWHADPPRD